MFINFEEYVTTLKKLDITPNQLLILWILIGLDSEEVGEYTKLLRIYNDRNPETGDKLDTDNLNTGIKKHDLSILYRLGYIKGINGDAVISLELPEGVGVIPIGSIRVTGKIRKKLLIDHAGEELWEIYPTQAYLNGVPFPARTADYETVVSKYNKAIKNDKELHSKILEAVEWGKKRQRIICGIDKFVGSRDWVRLFDEIEQQKGGGYGQEIA